jgi:protein O-mannosyl-transferase
LKGRRLALAACPLIAVLLHLPTLSHDFVFDDRAVMEDNPLLQEIGSLPRLLVAPYWNTPVHRGTLYRPVTSVSFGLDRAIAGGFHPAWFHVVNVLLHGVVTLLVTLLALQILPGLWPGTIAGLLFAVHPIHVEAVAGVVGRAELLAAAGVLGALLAQRRAFASHGGSARLWTVLAWASLTLGMLSKESALVGPLLGLLVDAARPVTPPPPRARRVAIYAGYALAAGLVLVLRYGVLGALGLGAPIPFIDNPAAAAGSLAGRLTALGTMGRYAALLMWPARLSADYSYDQIPVIHSWLDPWAMAGLLTVLAVLSGALLLRHRPACGAALLWMGAASLLTCNLIVFIGTLMAERLMYLPSVGFCLLAGCLVAAMRRRLAARAVIVAMLLACAAAAGRTAARLPDWHDDFALYSSGARVSPRSARMRYNLGNAHLRRDEYAAAESEYRAALAIYPDFGDARANLGMALLQQGRADQAREQLEAVVAAHPEQPDLHVNLGNAYRALGSLTRAESEYREALRLDPQAARALNNLGSVLLVRGDVTRAIELLRQAVAADPGTAVFRINLADALTADGRAAQAQPLFEEAYRLQPDLAEARRGLGEVALRQGDMERAAHWFEMSTEGSAPSARGANFLGYLRSRRDDRRGAIRAYEQAVSLDPGLEDAHRNLGLLYAEEPDGRDRAVRHLEQSLQLAPDQPGARNLRALLERLKRTGS